MYTLNATGSDATAFCAQTCFPKPYLLVIATVTVTPAPRICDLVRCGGIKSAIFDLQNVGLHAGREAGDTNQGNTHQVIIYFRPSDEGDTARKPTPPWVSFPSLPPYTQHPTSTLQLNSWEQ